MLFQGIGEYYKVPEKSHTGNSVTADLDAVAKRGIPSVSRIGYRMSITQSFNNVTS